MRIDSDAGGGRDFEQACERINPYWALVEEIAERLERERVLSGLTVAAICREFQRREQRAVAAAEALSS